MKLITLFSSLLFFIGSAVLAGQIIHYSLANQKLKNDYAELNHIKYGFLSIDAWNRQISLILAEEIKKLDLSKTDARELKKYIEAAIAVIIDGAFRKMSEVNSATMTGRIKQAFLNTFVSREDIKKGIPEYAEAVLAELTKPENKDRFRTVLVKKLKQYSRETYDPQLDLQINRILRQTETGDIESAKARLAELIAGNRRLVIRDTMLLTALSVILFLAAAINRKPLAPPLYILLVASLVLLLLAGVTTPMIDMEAKISHLGFVIMGHAVHFENQVLYFQSKSILDVFWILITNRDILMKFVGVLLITFSIFFPLLKLLYTIPYYYDYRRSRENPIVRFFILKSGKWSMADVMVVAMFMAYIGFTGIINSQFDQLSEAIPHQDMITTNGTALQPGYYLFLAYCMLGLFLSGFLTRKTADKQP